jgi:2-polyprenyl-6-methoxyphenol hydroxylase-like FAD-dependent oxidoreductase
MASQGQPRAIVVGAGVVGQAFARALAARGYAVQVRNMWRLSGRILWMSLLTIMMRYQQLQCLTISAALFGI